MLVCLMAVCAAASGQSAPADRPQFEVASIKECKNGEKAPPSTSSPDRVSLGCWPLWRLIAEAYDTFVTGKVDPMKLPVPMPLDGAPDWVNAARYTIDAKAESPQSGATMRGPMMQTLLETRFQLKVHRETREVPAYLMTVARGGLKLHPTGEGSCARVDTTDFEGAGRVMAEGKRFCGVPRSRIDGPLMVFDAPGISLDAFAKLLTPEGRGGRPVIDRTGIAGLFDIHLEWQNDNGGAASDPFQVSAITATRDQLGLRLDPGRGSREFLIVDHIEKPSAN